jgi:hypothetical protein
VDAVSAVADPVAVACEATGRRAVPTAVAAGMLPTGGGAVGVDGAFDRAAAGAPMTSTPAAKAVITLTRKHAAVRRADG